MATPRIGHTTGSAIVAVLLVALGGCGSGQSSSPTTISTTPPATAATTAPQAGGSEILYLVEGGVLRGVRPDGTGDRLVETEWGDPNPSPDGTELLATRGDDARPYIAPISGGAGRAVPVDDPALHLGCGAWSPDATRIACEGWHDDPALNGVYTVSTDGGTATRLTDANGGHDFVAAYSPLGTQVMFTRPTTPTDSDDAPADLYAVDIDGTHVVRLNPPGTIVGISGTGPLFEWSPDGTRVAFVGSRGRDFWANSDDRAVFVTNADGSHATRITDWGDGDTVSWSPDGALLAISTNVVSVPQIGLVRPDGTDLRTVPAPVGSLGRYAPQWSPDGKRLVFLSLQGGGNSELDTVRTDGNELVRIVLSDPAPSNWRWIER